MTLRLVYTIAFITIFLIEVIIAIGFVNLPFVRGSVGDILVIALIYFFLRATINQSPLKTATIAIASGFLVESLQYIHIAELMNLEKGRILYIVVGNTYSTLDLVMYIIGGSLALVIDSYGIITIQKITGQNKG